MKIAILSTDKLPAFLGDDHPNEESLFAEDDLLIASLAGIGIEASRVSWRRNDVDWHEFKAVIIRSTWDYIDSLADFLSFSKRIERCGVRLINSSQTVIWNHDKRYLAELDRLGLPVVPTFFHEGGAQDVSDFRGWLQGKERVVLKPTVGVGGYGVRVVDPGADLPERLAEASTEFPIMAQPFLPSIRSEGEWSFVFADEELLYSVLKTPKSGDYRVQVMYGAETSEREPSADDRFAAEQVYRSLPVDAHLARIDMVRLAKGGLGLMEVELIEPQLYLFDVPDAAQKLAEAIGRMLKVHR